MPCDCKTVGTCNGLQNDAPYLVSPSDMLNSPALITGPVVAKYGRQNGANVYYYVPQPSGQIQTQSPKIRG